MSDEMQRVIDEAAIRRVIDRYCHAVDRGTADDVVALFHPNGRLVLTLEDNDGLGASLDMVPKFQFRFQETFDIGNISRDGYQQWSVAGPVTPKVE